MSTPRLGILGAGQLGRMLAMAARPLDIDVRFYETHDGAPGAAVGTVVTGAYDDARALTDFARGLDVVTYEFENVPLAAAVCVARTTPVHPLPRALEVAQDRLVEKAFLASLGIPVVAHAAVDTRDELDAALASVGAPAILKTRRLGYDGKGQYPIDTEADADAAWRALGGVPLILEQRIGLIRELSVIGVRGRDGSTAVYPLTENRHAAGILRVSTAPATAVAVGAVHDARLWVERVMNELRYAGVLALELFDSGAGHLIVNEMAPRVHNSGHWTIEGAETSQFENHVRAVTGLPLGSTAAVGHSCMLNLIGSEPPLDAVLRIPGAHLHRYGKTPREGRKLGHITINAGTSDDLRQGVAKAMAVLGATAAIGPVRPTT